jgi:hypothetical protein
MSKDNPFSEVGSQLADALSSPTAELAEKKVKTITSTILHSPPLLITTTLGFSATTYLLYWRYFKRIPTTAYITPSTLRWKKTLVGRCTSVGDADGFRIYHTPGPMVYRDLFYAGTLKGKQSNGHTGGRVHLETLSIRLAGADAPESSHFGKPSQPLSKEAKEELEKLVLGKTVWCQAAHIDQYQRLVSKKGVAVRLLNRNKRLTGLSTGRNALCLESTLCIWENKRLISIGQTIRGSKTEESTGFSKEEKTWRVEAEEF